jgi:polyribonucleotide nucleotidyltransferase
MFNVFRKEIEWGGRTLVLETGRIARQADAAVVATYGGTTVLCTVVANKKPREGIDFFPLTVNYQEKAFAAGKIPGGYFKREGRPTEKETLTSRLIDRPIRPLFADGFRNETQVVCTTLTIDLENDADIVALIGTSAALTLSGVPFLGPIGAARVGYSNGAYVLNPTREQLEHADNKLDLIVAGTTEGVLMVESEAQELSEDMMLGAVNFGHQQFQAVIQAIIELAEQGAKEAWPMPVASYDAKALKKTIMDKYGAELRAAYGHKQKQVRYDAIGLVRSKVSTELKSDTLPPEALGLALHEVESDIVRFNILDTGKRIDGRDGKTVRQIVPEVGVLPRTHGSALFTRGETQALVVATLGTSQDEQIIDALDGEYRETFMLHYNFPPYSVGETGRMGSPRSPRNRSWQAGMAGPAPAAAEQGRFPLHHPRGVGNHRVQRLLFHGHGLRQSLSLMDAGVPLKNPCAGYCDGSDQGRRALSPCCPTSWVMKITSVTWTSRWPERLAASPPCRWTSRSPRSPRRSWKSHWVRPRTGVCTSSAK